MQALVPITLYGWGLVVTVLFLTMKPRRAVLASVILGWLFLPIAGFYFPGLPPYTKTGATTLWPLILAVAVDSGRVLSFRPRLFDIPAIVWCVVPMFSSVTNGLGVPDGINETFNQTVAWGVPYFLGRLYFSSPEGLQELAIGVFIGGLIYIPFCLYEVRMSPRLHHIIYGYHQRSLDQHMRLGGWRPKVFMQHGLALALWMTSATIVGIWLWASGTVKKLATVPMSVLVPFLGAATVLTRSIGALMLLVMGCGVLFLATWMKSRTVLLLFALAPVLYIGVRGSGVWDGQELVDTVEQVPLVGSRVYSLQYRLDAENILAEHARRQPVFGWGGWGRNRPSRMGEGAEEVNTDGLWVISFGTRGLVGLVALTTLLVAPAYLVAKRFPVAAWSSPMGAPVAGLAVVAAAFAIDCLFNAMLNPVFVLVIGGLTGLVTQHSFKHAMQRLDARATKRSLFPQPHRHVRGHV